MAGGSVSQVTNSRNKGCVGEREFADYLKAHGLEARRGQQFSGSKDSPDVVCPDLPDVHWEVKRREAGSVYLWLEQALEDGGAGKLHVVAHRRSHKEWIAVLPMEELVRLLILRELHHATKAEDAQTCVELASGLL